MPDYLMGIDVGTTGTSAMLFDSDGKQYGTAYREYVSHYPAEHHVEQDGETLVSSAFAVCREAEEQSGVDPQNIQAVSITSQRATFGLLDADNRLINGRFIGWQDNRAHSILDEMAAKMAPAELYRITGMPLTPTYSLEKLVWFQRFQPEVYAKTHKIVFPADYVLWRFGADELTTEATNACCSGMIDVHRLDWSDEVLAAYRMDRSKFSPLVVPGTVLGRINSQIAALMGDALATWPEASAAFSKRAISCTGGTQTLTAIAMAKLGFETIMEYGLQAKAAVENQVVTPAVEKVIEANILLSGVGWESGGLATAHAIANSLPMIHETHGLLHGEKVAFGLVTQLCLEQDWQVDRIYEVVDFLIQVGLPVTLADMNMQDVSRERFLDFAKSVSGEGSFVYNHPFPVLPTDIVDAIYAADSLGRRRQSIKSV